ncbi:MAG: ABC transporter substrate-binding protein [Acidobacteriota bacterium]|nr:ABC transporter substrate-binding protein [Acidobacteriota bacterium]
MDRKTFIACLIAGCLALPSCAPKPRQIVVGSKNFTEQLILGEIAAQHIENRLHQKVDRKLNLGGTLLAHQALLGKQIDLYPEYTGTALTNVLKLQGITDPNIVMDRVRTEYRSQMALEWLDPLGFSNTFALVVSGEDARARHLETLTDAANDPAGFTLGAGYEFLTRPDGFGTLNAGYPIHWVGAPKSMDLGLLYTALQQKKVNMVAASSTDGMLSVLDVKVLKDDKQSFPPYQACYVVRADTLAAFPELKKALGELSGKLTDDAIRKLNYEVDGKHRPVPEVAKDWLRGAGL